VATSSLRVLLCLHPQFSNRQRAEKWRVPTVADVEQLLLIGRRAATLPNALRIKRIEGADLRTGDSIETIASPTLHINMSCDDCFRGGFSDLSSGYHIADPAPQP
jgi:hypothetical protein